MIQAQRVVFAATLSLLVSAPSAAMAQAQNPTPQRQEIAEKYKSILKSLHPASGDVELPTAGAVLHLGKDYYFLNSQEAKRVLIDGWRNPPEQVSDVMGMVFPAGKTFVDDTWAAVVTYHQVGYVTDDDAKSADYSKVISSAREQEDTINKERQKSGFPVQHLVGWAQPPAYDPVTHSVIWARDIRFGDQTDDALNYDVRMLGRRGVLSLNMVSEMSKLPDIRNAAGKFGQAAAFEPGSRYSDYNAGKDQKAGYGIAGLVAAGVGVVAAKKLGLVALLAIAGKKLFVLIAAFFVGVANWFKRVFRKNTAG